MTVASTVEAAVRADHAGDKKVAWHSLTPEQACERLGVEVPLGLDAAEIERRRAQVGPNKLAEAKKEPGWRAFLRQYRDLMQLVLLGAAIVSIVALQDSTGIVILGVTLLNAILGLYQEGKAAESVAALQKMLVIKAHARRGGDLVDIPAEELVPGDIVSFEAGDKIPADGRLLVAATLEIEEAALTGESTPVGKSIDPVAGEAVPLGDRIDMAYMNSTVTRGRGEMVVTATGMTTEVGQISGMLGRLEQEKTPLTRQLDQLTILVALVAAAALVLVIVIGLIRGDSFYELFLIAISVAVAAIPTELPAVVTTMLSLGTQALAAKGAIVKRLRSVETLGSTSAICSDKTGTLTLNQMTARQLVVVGRRYSIEGVGYSTVGRILRVAGAPETSLEPFLLPIGARHRRRRQRGRDCRRPDRGSPGRPGRKGWTRCRRNEARLPAHRRGAVRLRLQADGDIPRDGAGRPEGHSLLRQGRARRPARSVDGDPRRGRLDRSCRERPQPRPGRERPARRGGSSRAGRGHARYRHGRLRPGRPATSTRCEG